MMVNMKTLKYGMKRKLTDPQRSRSMQILGKGKFQMNIRGKPVWVAC